MQNIISIPKDTKLYIVGDLHAHWDQFDQAIKEIEPSPQRIFISVGDVFDKGQGREVEEKMTCKLAELQEQGACYVVCGNHELKRLRKERGRYPKDLKWWFKQPLSLTFSLVDGSLLTVVHAGITPKMSWEDLKTNTEVCYVRDLDENGKMIHLKWIEENGQKKLIPEKNGGKPWHESYDGRFGYVASGHNAQKDGKAKFFNYSCNLDSAVYETGILTVQEFSDSGRGLTMTFSGPAYGTGKF